MKTTLTTVARPYTDPAIEKMIDHESALLKAEASKLGKHLALRNLEHSASNETLLDYIGSTKTGHEKVAGRTNALIQANAQFSQAKVESNSIDKTLKTIDAKIVALKGQNHSAKYELDNSDPKSVFKRMRNVHILNCILGIGELILNSRSFQVSGDVILLTFFLSVAVSLATIILAEVTALFAKEATTNLQKLLITGTGFIIASFLFAITAHFRSVYMQSHGVNISPFIFYALNSCLFIITGAIAYRNLPTWKEISTGQAQIGKYKEIEKRENEIKELEKERKAIRYEYEEAIKMRFRIVQYSQDCMERIEAHYREAVEQFKVAYRINRTDLKVPHCFSDATPPLKFNRIELTLNN